MVLSASRFAWMAATALQRENLLHIVSEYEPDLPGKRHIRVQVREKGACMGTRAMVIVLVTHHG